MSKYNNFEDTNVGMSRVKRNQSIYNSNDMSELSRFKSTTNVSVISDAPKEIDINKIREYIYSKEEEKEDKRRRLDVDLPEHEEKKIERQEFRTYDINSVLENARESKELDYEEQRHRKINNTQYNILKNIKINEAIKEDDDKDELNTQEKTIVDLIQDIQHSPKKEENDVNDLFKDLMGDSENTVVMAPIDEDEINRQNMKETLTNITTDLEMIKQPASEYTQELIFEKEKLKELDKREKTNTDDKMVNNTSKLSSIDKSFYTNSMSFTKTDFEGFEDLEKSTKTGTFTKIAIVLAILLLLITIFLILNFVFEWNIL